MIQKNAIKIALFGAYVPELDEQAKIARSIFYPKKKCYPKNCIFVFYLRERIHKFGDNKTAFRSFKYPTPYHYLRTDKKNMQIGTFNTLGGSRIDLCGNTNYLLPQ